MSAYSARFYAGDVNTGGILDAYTVPAGNVAIVQHIDGYQLALNPDQLFVVLTIGETTVSPITIVWPGGASIPWQGKLVLNAGEQLGFQSAQGLWQVQASGALIPLA